MSNLLLKILLLIITTTPLSAMAESVVLKQDIKDYVQNKDWIYFMGGKTGSTAGFHKNNSTGLLYYDAKNFQVSRDANWDNNKSKSNYYLTDRYSSTCR